MITAWLGEFINNSFMPHGHCLLWRLDLLLMHVGSDIVIGLSYFSIAATMYWFVKKKEGRIEFSWMLLFFSSFIFACGVTHFVEIINIWNGLYYIEGLIKVMTAAVSALTAALLWPLAPKLMLLPSLGELNQLNQSLKEELDLRQLEGFELLKIKNFLETEVNKRTAEMETTLEKLRKALSEKELAEKRLQQTINSVSEAIISVNDEGMITQFNQAAMSIFGYNEQELSQLSLSTLVPSNAKTAHENHMQNFFQQPVRRSMGSNLDLYGVTKQGEPIPVEIGLCPVETIEGTQVIASIVNATERREFINKIKQSETRYRTVVDASNDVICVTDHSGRVLSGQPSWESYCGLSQSESYGLGWLNAIHENNRHSILEKISTPEKSHTDFSLEINLWCHSEAKFHIVKIRGIPIFQESSLAEWFFVASNIQSQKDYETLILQKTHALESRNKELEEFNEIVSHDLQEPLRKVISFGSRLKQYYTSDPEKTEDYLT